MSCYAVPVPNVGNITKTRVNPTMKLSNNKHLVERKSENCCVQKLNANLQVYISSSITETKRNLLSKTLTGISSYILAYLTLLHSYTNSKSNFFITFSLKGNATYIYYLVMK